MSPANEKTAQEESMTRVLHAIEAIKKGQMVIMVDDEERENEGDLVFAATDVTPEHINFMSKEARGLICLSLEPETVERLKLPLMEDYQKGNSPRSTAFTVSIEARTGVTTGISAHDRARTVAAAVAENAQPEDIVVPGHIFPLRARPGGVLERAGHTEGSVDLAKLAGKTGAGVICEIMNDDGTMARRPDLERFAKKHQIPIVSIADIINFRLMHDSLIEEIWRAPIQTARGVFEGVLFRSLADEGNHLALVKTSKKSWEDQIVDVRVHRQRQFLDVFSDPDEGGRRNVEYGLDLLASASNAVLLYLDYRHSSEDLKQELTAMNPKRTLGMRPKPSRPIDPRMLGLGSQILRYLGVRRMNVHMAQPLPLRGLSGFGLEVVEIKPIHRGDDDREETPANVPLN